jgi:CRP-like cAMP-binding protein
VRQSGTLLLNKLTDEELKPLLPLLEMVSTGIKDVLYRQGEPIRFVYFPCTAAQSCLVTMEDGFGIEVATMGNEGFTGVRLLLSATLATETIVCQIAGNNLRMNVDDFRAIVKEHARLLELLHCAAQAYLTQISQSVACNRLHNVNMRFARWLLVTHDRVQGDKFHLTQEFMASMLGVHRPSVSLVANEFQQAGIIRYSRGHMHILDRDKLEESACECYAKVRGQFERLLDISHGG